MGAFRHLMNAVLLALLIILTSIGSKAQAQPYSVLWVNGMPDYPPDYLARYRKDMSDFLGAYQGGALFNTRYARVRRGGGLAQALSQGSYDIVVLDLAERAGLFSQGDIAALQRFYASGKRGLMLDGSLTIRSSGSNRTTRFPGVNGSNGAFLVNQIAALGRAGGGILIGTDHHDFQISANRALAGIIPQARFRGLTNPSTNGDFIGTSLLAEIDQVKAADILRHWESIPSQGEAPVGDFVDFQGNPVTLFSLVEAADKPGNGRKRPYISASFNPGGQRTAIDSETPVIDNMPTRKGPSN